MLLQQKKMWSLLPLPYSEKKVLTFLQQKKVCFYIRNNIYTLGPYAPVLPLDVKGYVATCSHLDSSLLCGP